jgi:RecB family exonuclease
MSKKLWLSYSGYQTYKTCPKRYQYSRVLKVDPKIPESKHNAVVGSVVQKVFEDFYNEDFWRLGSECSAALLKRTEYHCYNFLDTNFIDYNAPHCKTPLEFLELSKEYVLKTLSAIKRETLLGPYSRSEVALQAHLQGSYYTYGIVDFLIRKQDGTILLIDGKSSAKREKHVDMNQLVFYALSFYLLHQRLPTKTGVLYYAFADDAEEAFDWVSVERKDLKALKVDLIDTFTQIQKTAFRATPSNKACRYCPWKEECKEYRKFQIAEYEKKKWRDAEKDGSLDLYAEGNIGFPTKEE